MKRKLLLSIPLAFIACAAPEAAKQKPEEQKPEEQKPQAPSKIYNLIILDQSGSMESIKHEAMYGYNETLQTIKSAQKKHQGKQEHYVTLVIFNTDASKILYNAVPCDKAKELSEKDYEPNGGTPLYDAMGLALHKVSSTINPKEKHHVLVSIITDGEENSSKEYSGNDIKKKVENLEKQGWTFTYIGANQDLYKVTQKLGIRNTLDFAPSVVGVQRMNAKNKGSQEKWFDKEAAGASKEELQQDFFKDSEKKSTQP